MSGLEVPGDGPPPFEDRVWPRPWMKAFLRALALQPNVTAAAQTAGLSRQAVRYAALRHPEFAEAWKEALQMSFDLMERIAHQRATTGQQVTETRAKVKRVRAENGEMVVVEEETTTITSAHISDPVLIRYLAANRPERFGTSLDVVVRASPNDPPVSEIAAGDQVYRMPSRDRALELARALVEAEEHDMVELASEDVVELGDESAFKMGDDDG